MAATSVASRMDTAEVEGFIYSHERMVYELMRFVIMEGLRLDTGSRPGFVNFCQSMNPDYTEVSAKTLMYEAKKEYDILKPLLHSTLTSLTHKISLACDVWSNEDLSQFVRVTARWIDSDWLMQTRVLNFKLLDFESDTAGIVSQPIMESMDSWGVKDKIFSITFDDACDSTDQTEILRNVIDPVFGEKLFHGRCVCRDLNSCIQDVFEAVGTHVERIRHGIGRIYLQPESYSDVCEKYGMETKIFMVDSENNWNSTRKMLKSCLPYKDVLNEFIVLGCPGDDSFTINEHDWEVSSVFCRILDVFYEAVDCISQCYYPSSSGILLHLVNIAKLFAEYRGNFVFEEKFSVMKESFLNHFNRISVLYCMAAVMDPRIKLTGCETLMESFYQSADNVEVNIDQEKAELHNLLYEMHSYYLAQSSMKPCSSELLDTNDFAWSVISQKREKTEDSAFNELTFYLQSPHNYFLSENEKFDILGWWKKHEIIYPVLSTMARDLLTIPVSTLAPDCAFFILNEDRNILNRTAFRLRGKTILELYTCLRDWLHAKARTQGKQELDDDEITMSGFDDQESEGGMEVEG